jgi:hypothetical protein
LLVGQTSNQAGQTDQEEIKTRRSREDWFPEG